MRKIIKKILELWYPTTCVFCGEICKKGICKSCSEKIDYIQEPLCKKCGKPIHSQEGEFCFDCQRRMLHYEQGRSLWLHKRPVSSSIYDFKYKNKRVYGEIYGREMAEQFNDLIRMWEIDVLIPVPLHRKRQRKRGYNQAEIIARELGKKLGIPVDMSVIIRERETTPQKELGQKNRRKNLKKAFRLTGKRLTGKNILLIDDIYTTGSTIDAMAEVLMKTGCEKIYFLTISIGQGF